MRSSHTFRLQQGLAVLAGIVLAMAAGCDGSRGGRDGGAGEPSLFVDGCPVHGLASARRIDRPDLAMQGPQVLGEEGDFLLMNDRAAFIITDPDDVDTYWYYGGILVDAVALDGCAQAGPERYEEFLPLVVQVDVLDLLEELSIEAASVRGFRGEWVEILNDGSDGGDAVVRVHGRDDFFWLVEYTLVTEAYHMGTPKALSEPMGIEIFIDYVLPPDSPVLRIEVNYRNSSGERKGVIPAAAHLFGPTTDLYSYSLVSDRFVGFNFDLGVPWLTTASPQGDGALAFAMEDALLTTMEISGVNAVFDIKRGIFPLRLKPAGNDGDTARVTYFMGLGGSDGNSAERALHEAMPEAFSGVPYEFLPIHGSVLDAETGGPVEGARIEAQVQQSGGCWRTIHRFRSGSDGDFGGAVARFNNRELAYRLTARVEGRADPAPISFTTSAIPSPVISFEPDGVLAYEIRDELGRVLPARITLWQEGGLKRRIFAADGIGEAAVIPGTYDVSVTRGYEYEPYHGTVTVLPSGSAPMAVALERVVDTAGFLGVDGHMHAAPSPDSKVSIPDRIRTAATEGLEVAVSTDHEYVGSWQSGIDETGLDEWVATIPGCELTAVIPEHINLYHVEPRFDLDGRGGYVRWYGLDIDEIFALARDRGAGVISLNHPAYLRLVDYDRISGTALLDDPTLIGLDPDARLWSWNFDVIEYMNGHHHPFEDPEGRGSGYFDDWMSFLNHGHPITAMGVTDIHGFDVPGQPRTYFASSTDEPLELDEGELVASIVGGRALVSAGAFARISVNGEAGMGDLATAPDGSVDVALRIEAIPGIDVAYFLVFVNCAEVLKVAVTDPDGVVKYDDTFTVPVASDANLVVAGFGMDPLPRGLRQFDATGVPRFTTNAVYIDVDGNGLYDPPGGKTCAYDIGPPE